MFKVAIFILMCVIASFAQLSFNQQASLQQARYAHGCVSLNGTAYVLGGTIGEVYTQSVEYLASNGSWIYNPTFMPTQRSQAAYLPYQGRFIFAFGGATNNISHPVPSNAVEVFDSVYNNWTTIAPLNVGRIGHYAFLFYTVNPITNATVDNVAVIGGDSQNVNSTYELATLSFVNGTLTASNWVTHPSTAALVNAQQSATVVETIDTIYFLGGLFNSSSLNSVYSLNKTVFAQSPTTIVIQQQANLTYPQYGASGAVMESNGQVYLFGGINQQDFSYSENVTVLTNTTNSQNQTVWVNVTVLANVTVNFPMFLTNVSTLLPSGWAVQPVNSVNPIAFSCAVAANGDVYVTGGVYQQFAANGTAIGNYTIYSAVQSLFFPSDASSTSGLSNGAIAGIVIGSLVGVAIIIGIIVFITKRGKRHQYREV